MITIKTEVLDSQTTLILNGRIDTNTSEEVQEKILESLGSCKKLVLDFKGVSYISSAGLRALLTGHKTAAAKKASMEILGAGPAVISVLKTVGFDKILNLV